MATDMFTKDYIENYSKKQAEPQWMTDFRIKAMDAAEKLAMPKPDKTKITNWDFSSFSHDVKEIKALSDLEQLPNQVKKLIDFDEQQNIMILHDTTLVYTCLSQTLIDKGVIFCDLITAFKKYPEHIKKYYMTDAVSVNEHKLTALHAALCNGGAFIYIPKGVVVSSPLQTIFWQDAPDQGLFNHVVLVADEQSEVTYVENYVATNEKTKAVMNIVSEVFVKKGANVSYGAVDHFSQGTTSYINRRGLCYRDAKLEWALGQMNDGDTISENVTHLLEDHAISYAKAVSVGRGEQTQNFTANIVNHGKHTDGKILQHGVMKDKATGIFHGIGKIEHGGTKANAEQESRILMLNKEARGDANPILLIEEDDVTAGHAASVGRVDPLQLYYLMSRGISKHEAERLIIHGFLAPVVNAIKIKAVRTQLTEVIEGKVN